MNAAVMQWVDSILARKPQARSASALEVGSYDINGSVRTLFTGPYVGLDVVPGPGVDIVGEAKNLPFADNSFDVVVSTEMLEHDLTFWLSLAEMGRVLRPHGNLILTMRANGFGYHGDAHYKDAYRFLPDAAPTLAAIAGCSLIEVANDRPEEPGLFIWAEKITAP